MREMKDSGIKWMGSIPVSWKTQRVKHGFYRKKVEAHQDNPVVLSLARSGVRVRDISNNEGQIAESYYNYNPVDVDDLLINPMDLYSGANCSISKVKGVISQAYINLRYRDGYNPEYYDYYFKLQYWMMAFFAHGKGVSFENRWTLNADTLMNYPIIKPSYEEQCRIVDYLDEKCAKIDAIIEKQQEIIEKLKEYKISVITEAVTKGVNTDVKIKDSGIDWIEYIPAMWEVAKLNKCLFTYKGYAFKSDKFSGSGIPVVRVSEIKNGTVLAAEMHITEMEPEYKNVVLNSGDILMTTVGSNPKVLNSAVGQLARLPEELNGALLNQNAVCLRAKEGINTDFLYYFLTIKRYREHLNLIAHGTANQYSISLAELLDFYMLIPPYEEQCAIADSLNAKTLDIDKTLIDREEAISKLYDYKKSLIFEAVTGKKEV